MATINLNVNRFGTTASPLTVTSADVALLPNDGLTHLYVIVGGSAVTCTVYEKRPCNYGHTSVNFTFVCAANGTTRLGTFRKDRYNRDDGKLEATFSATVTAHGVQIIPEEGRI